MGDQDLEIRIRGEADLAAIKQWEAEIDKLVQKVSSAKDRLSGGINRGFLGSVPVELATAGPLPPGPLSPRAEELLGKESGGLTHVAAEMERATLFSGINLARARQEATILARELATGVPTTRTLSSLLGSLDQQLLIAVGAGFALNKAITANAQRQLEINQEVGKQIDQVIRLQQEWDKLALSAKDIPSLAGIGESAAKSLDVAKQKLFDFQNAGISGLKELSDKLTAGIPGAGKIFENLFKDELGRLSDDYEAKREAAGRAIESGLLQQKRIYEDISKGDAGIAGINQRLEEQRAILATLDPKTNIESWLKVEGIIERITAELQTAAKIQEQRKIQDIEAQRRAGEISGQSAAIQTSSAKVEEALTEARAAQTHSPAQMEAILKARGLEQQEEAGAGTGVQAVLRNEERARQAEAEGHSRDADLFRRSAQQYERGLGPAGKEQLAAIREQTAVLRQLLQAWQ